MDFSQADALPFDRLAAPYEAASDALARLDERLRASPVAEAFVLRAHFNDACAALWAAGDFVLVEDLVLHDANMDARAPTHELVRAHAVLVARRRIAARGPDWALSDAGLAALRGARTPAQASAVLTRAAAGVEAKEDPEGDDETPAGAEFGEIDALIARTSRHVESLSIRRDESGLVYDADWNENARLAAWCEGLEAGKRLPPLLAAGLALDAWRAIDPLQHRAWLGPLLVAALLRARGKTKRHLMALHAGLRLARRGPRRGQDFAGRLIAFAQTIEATAEAGSRELDRLTLARALLLRKCAGRRGNSRMPRLVEFCLVSPVVTVPLAARELGVSQQAASVLIGELASNLRELTGRGRYRAWSVM